MQEWPPAVLYSFLRVRPLMEGKLLEVSPGVHWEDFAKALQALTPEELHQAAGDLRAISKSLTITLHTHNILYVLYIIIIIIII